MPISRKSLLSPESLSSRDTALAVTTRDLVLDSGKLAKIRSRLIPLTEGWNITVWEWDQPAGVMEHYWSVQHHQSGVVLDPFGLVAWPGAKIAAQQALHYQHQIKNSIVLVLGAGPGVESQALAMLGAKKVIASDINPTTLQLLRYGAQQAGLDEIIQEQGKNYDFGDGTTSHFASHTLRIILNSV